MTRLYLIRHAKPAAVWGADDSDPGLDATGQTQASAVAEKILQLPASERPKGVTSSPLRRCLETAEPLAKALGVRIEIDPAVGEIPTPAALSQSARPDWLREAIAGRWQDIRGDLDYDLWRHAVA